MTFETMIAASISLVGFGYCLSILGLIQAIDKAGVGRALCHCTAATGFAMGAAGFLLPAILVILDQFPD